MLKTIQSYLSAVIPLVPPPLMEQEDIKKIAGSAQPSDRGVSGLPWGATIHQVQLEMRRRGAGEGRRMPMHDGGRASIRYGCRLGPYLCGQVFEFEGGQLQSFMLDPAARLPEVVKAVSGVCGPPVMHLDMPGVPSLATYTKWTFEGIEIIAKKMNVTQLCTLTFRLPT